MKILITGGLGFQGSHLTDYLLLQGHKVTVLNTLSDRAQQTLAMMPNKPTIVWGSITDREAVRKTIREHDVIFHLAARIHVDQSITDPSAYLDVNVYGTYHVLEAIREFGGRLIMASTCEVYGAPINGKPITEDAEFRPHSPYAASKASADRLCFAYFKTYGINVTIVRPFNIYGERQKEDSGGAAIPIFVRRALNREPIKIFGDGMQSRDYMNIDDLVCAYNLIFQHQETAGEAYNFGSGEEVHMRDIANHVATKLGGIVEYTDARPGEVKSFIGADIKKVQRMGFSPKVALYNGIDRYIEWRKTK